MVKSGKSRVRCNWPGLHGEGVSLGPQHWGHFSFCRIALGKEVCGQSLAVSVAHFGHLAPSCPCP